MAVTPENIEQAHEAIRDHIVRTPTVPATRLSDSCNARLWLKLENLQYTASFKDRGSCHKLQLLAASDNPPTGVIAASAGNHAQGVAYHAGRLNLPSTIVMPITTPFAKIQRTEGHGAKVVLWGESVAECSDHAKQLAQERGEVFVHPYDDEDIIAGQGTAAREMLEDAPQLKTLVAPIGGGGLCAGMAIWAKHINPSIRIFGVQMEECPSMQAAMRDAPAPKFNTHTLADGIAVKTPGAIPLKILKEHLEDVLLVSETDIETAVQMLAAQQKIVAEGAGAAGIAAINRHPEIFKNNDVGTVICGGNIDHRLLTTVLLRGLKDEGKIAKLIINIRDVPGSLSRVTQMISATGADVIDIEHQRLFNSLAPREAELHVVMETRGPQQVTKIVTQLREAGFATTVI